MMAAWQIHHKIEKSYDE